VSAIIPYHNDFIYYLDDGTSKVELPGTYYNETRLSPEESLASTIRSRMGIEVQLKGFVGAFFYLSDRNRPILNLVHLVHPINKLEGARNARVLSLEDIRTSEILRGGEANHEPIERYLRRGCLPEGLIIY
jgi:hypothetical protein